jgi:hypothetical protein
VVEEKRLSLVAVARVTIRVAEKQPSLVAVGRVTIWVPLRCDKFYQTSHYKGVINYQTSHYRCDTYNGTILGVILYMVNKSSVYNTEVTCQHV